MPKIIIDIPDEIVKSISNEDTADWIKIELLNRILPDLINQIKKGAEQ